MKDFIIDSGNLIGQNEGAKLAFQTSQNTTILEIKGIADYKTTLESLLSNRELKLKL